MHCVYEKNSSKTLYYQKNILPLRRKTNKTPTMETNQLPQTTTVIQAEPWAKDHVAHFITTRAISKAPNPRRVITAEILTK